MSKIYQQFYLQTEYLIKEYRNELRKAFRAESIDLSIDQWMILNAIGEEEGLSQAQIAELTAKEPAAVMRMLDDMTSRDLIARIPTASDRRRYQIILSSKGRELYVLTSKISNKVQSRGLKHLDFERTKELVQTLKVIRLDLNI